jgi:hypothetical protein
MEMEADEQQVHDGMGQEGERAGGREGGGETNATSNTRVKLVIFLYSV